MELFGGFMVMLSIIGFFLTVIWFILPFVILSIKGKTDRIHVLVEDMNQRLTAMETRLAAMAEPAEASAAGIAEEVPLAAPPQPPEN
jgi:hypothetical protein